MIAVARPLDVRGPNSLGEVEAAYRAATDPDLRERLLAIHMAMQGEMGLRGIAKALMRGRASICRWLRAFRAGGIAGLLRDSEHKGKHPTPSVKALVELEAGLETGRWKTVPEIKAWLEEEHHVVLSPGGVRYWLRRLRASLKVPRPSHVDKDPAAAEAFKKEFDHKMAALAGAERKPLYIWVEDEHRYGLNSITRRVWTLKGSRPSVPYQKKREYGDLYGALELGTGDIQLLHIPSVSLEATGIFLRQLKATDPEGIHVVVYDGAGWHPLPGDASLPEGVHILPLPPYSPELNPVETLWDRVKQDAANAVSKTLQDAERVIDNALRPFWESTARVCRLLGNHWITRAGVAYLGHPCGVIAT